MQKPARSKGDMRAWHASRESPVLHAGFCIRYIMLGAEYRPYFVRAFAFFYIADRNALISP